MSGMGEGCGWTVLSVAAPMQNPFHPASSTLLPPRRDAMLLRCSIYNEEARINAHCERAMMTAMGK
jgi:hypothetical protein